MFPRGDSPVGNGTITAQGQDISPVRPPCQGMYLLFLNKKFGRFNFKIS